MKQYTSLFFGAVLTLASLTMNVKAESANPAGTVEPGSSRGDQAATDPKTSNVPEACKGKIGKDLDACIKEKGANPSTPRTPSTQKAPGTGY